MYSALHLSDRLNSLRGTLRAQVQDATNNIARREAAPLAAESGINVASIFNGIGCPLIALDELNIPINKLFIQDWEDYPALVCKHHYPNADVDTLPRNAQDIKEHHIKAMGSVQLLIITPPCTDFSGLKRGPPDMRKGMAGPTGVLMKDALNIIAWYLKYNPHGMFILENVVFDDMDDWQTVCAALGQPKIMNANVYSYTHRKRSFWTNIVTPDGWEDPGHEPWHPNEVLAGRRLMLNRRATTITASWRGGDAPFEHTQAPIKVWDPSHTDVQFSNMTEWHTHAQYLQPEEAERLMGIPTGYTDVQPCTAADRLKAVGNGIDVRTIKHLLQHARWLPTSTVEAGTRPAGLNAWAPLTSITKELSTPLQLNAATMVEWLTPGPCPHAEHDRSWIQSASHPTVEVDALEWAQGASLRFEGDRSKQVLAENSKSCEGAPEQTAAVIRKELLAGRMLGPFPVVPLAGFRVVPRAMKDEMQKSNKWRPISLNNLPVGDAVNEGIPPSPTPICLPTHDSIRTRIARAKQRSPSVLLAKRDIRLAYRLHQVRPMDWNLCGVQWDGQLFIDTHLSFGCRSSVDRFLTISDAIEWTLRRWGVQAIHYIDDFIFIAESQEEADEALRKFHIICDAWGIPIKEEKDVGPATQVELLGVVYDTDAMTASMPDGTLARIDDACSRALASGLDTKAATSLVGLMTWASACIPQAAPFVTALRYMADEAATKHLKFIRITARVRQDLSWWQQAIATHMAPGGTSILPRKVQAVHTLSADAGTEWGLGAHDDEHFYKAKHTKEVLDAAMRKKHHSSKFLELFNLLVMARVMSVHWEGKHVAVNVDNYALPRTLRRMTSPNAVESAMLREIALLQIQHHWSWTVTWIPREENDAADALSKNDMPRFRASGPAHATELVVRPQHMRVPAAEAAAHVAASQTAAQEVAGDDTSTAIPAGRGRDAHAAGVRPTRVLFQPTTQPLNNSTLESHLRGQLTTFWRSLSAESSKSGVKHYLKFADRCGWDADRILPDWNTMVDNILLYMLDAVQTYPFRTASGLEMKKAISAGSLSTYLSHINGWYSAETNQPRGVTTSSHPAKLLAELTQALPKSNCQKTGFTADNMRAMLASIQAHGGEQAATWSALFQLAWFGVLRPGECVPQQTSTFDVSKHPTRANIIFYCEGQRIQPAVGSMLRPTHMVFVVKYSKTDQDRLTQDVVIGRTDGALCCVTAMWAYMCCTAARPLMAPLFEIKGKAVTYKQLLAAVKKHSQASQLEPIEYGGHSFRIGGSQALAAAGRSITYIMSYGRWRCTESVLRYVKTPLHIRMLDAGHMAKAATHTRWDALEVQVRDYYANTTMQDRLWDASLMVA